MSRTGQLITAQMLWSLWALMLSHLVPRGSSTTFFFSGWFTSFTMFQIKMSHYSKGSTFFSKRWQRRSGYRDTMIIWRCGKFTFPSRQRNFISGWTLSSDLDELKLFLFCLRSISPGWTEPMKKNTRIMRKVDFLLTCWIDFPQKDLKPQKSQRKIITNLHIWGGGGVILVFRCVRCFFALLDSSPCFLNFLFWEGDLFCPGIEDGSGQFEVQNYHHWNTLEVQPHIFIVWIADCHFL